MHTDYHSCETAIVRVVNDILFALDRVNEAILILDYTGAFDTISQHIFESRLEEKYGITGWKCTETDNILP